MGKDVHMITINSAEILCVGTEILIGDIVNTNAAFLSKKLAELGINQYRQEVVGDNPARLESMIREALDRCDLLIMTGGLGPTYDDLTKETAAKCMGRTLSLHQRSFERMQSYFTEQNKVMTENNRKQAFMPEGAVVFDNDNGTAPGLAIEDEARGKIVIMLPGPPRETIPMFTDYVMPYLSKFTSTIFVSKNLNIHGIGESHVESLLHEEMLAATNPTLAPYCKEGEVRLRVTAKAVSREEGLAMCDEMIEKVRKTPVGPYIYGIDTSLEQAVVQRLKAEHLHVTAAESCTGGLVAERLTSVPGASDVFDGSIISYADRTKASILHVSEETLSQHGAVSAQTACEMAEGVRVLMSADIGVSVTGFAGPDGSKVGLIYVACADGLETKVTELHLKGNREHNRNIASNYALSMILDCLRNR